ncbi:MAG: glutamine amidotransferase [Alphaproteobacteria bacterium]
MSDRLVILVTHSEHASAGAVGEALARRGFRTRTCCPMRGDSLPPLVGGRPYGAVATVAFGGPQYLSEIEKYPYLSEEAAWLGEQARSGAPVLGICLGAQMMALALGAAVRPHAEGLREIGYYPIWPTPAGRELFGEGLHVYHWHGEGFELPKGAELLATGERFRHQAFRVGERAYGLQFHPEMTRPIMERWIASENGSKQLREHPEAQSPGEQRRLGAVYEAEMRAWLDGFIERWLNFR